LTEADLDKHFEIGSFKGTLKSIVESLKKAYCGTLSVQVASAKPRIREWFINEMEKNLEGHKIPKDEKLNILKQLVITEAFENFLHTRYVGAKRFSIEGSDAVIPMLEKIASTGVKLGLKDITVGMAHRGRLSVLANFVGKAYGDIFSEFDGK